jgi:hypothetical protein
MNTWGGGVIPLEVYTVFRIFVHECWGLHSDMFDAK